MIREPLVFFATCEIAGRVRGKGFPLKELKSRMKSGVGWVPTNTMISCFGPIADTPFGATGDLILVPDEKTKVEVDFGDGTAAERWFLGDIRLTDGTPWECCPRHFLKRALAALDEVAGLQLYSTFEQEFMLESMEDRPGAPYSLDAWRRQGSFGETFMAAIRAAGVEPDSFLPEYGARQYEVTTAPAIGVTAADDAIKVREMARATAHRSGNRATFAPILAPDGTGNGVHIHFSFRDRAGRPATHDPGGVAGLTATAAHFMAGIIAHMPALCAVTAPSTVSYIRLRPNKWAPTWAYLADRDREASLRVCPVLSLPGVDAAKSYNVEFRVCDAAASPYLALGALVHAGVDGIRRNLPLTPSAHVAAMSEDARDAAGIRPLPRTLGEALDALEHDAAAKEWFGVTYLDAYLRHKRAEIRMLDGLDEAEQCRRYGATY